MKTYFSFIILFAFCLVFADGNKHKNKHDDCKRREYEKVVIIREGHNHHYHQRDRVVVNESKTIIVHERPTTIIVNEQPKVVE